MNEVQNDKQGNDIFEIVLTTEEKLQCLEQILKKNNRILHVFTKALDPQSGYDYKVYVKGLVLYVSTSNNLFKGGLVSIVVNLCSILQNEFEYKDIKKIVYDNANYLSYFMNKIKEKESE